MSVLAAPIAFLSEWILYHSEEGLLGHQCPERAVRSALAVRLEPLAELVRWEKPDCLVVVTDQQEPQEPEAYGYRESLDYLKLAEQLVGMDCWAPRASSALRLFE